MNVVWSNFSSKIKWPELLPFMQFEIFLIQKLSLIASPKNVSHFRVVKIIESGTWMSVCDSFCSLKLWNSMERGLGGIYGFLDEKLCEIALKSLRSLLFCFKNASKFPSNQFHSFNLHIKALIHPSVQIFNIKIYYKKWN